MSHCRFQHRWDAIALAGLMLCMAACRLAAETSLAGKPFVGRNADGHLEVFKVDADGELRHRWQKLTDGSWSAWSTLGGTFLPGAAVCTNTEGGLEAFAVERASGGLSMIRQTASNSLDWSDWSHLGGKLRAGLAVGQDLDGRLEVFGVDADTGALRHIWETNLGGRWSSWAKGGGNLAQGLAVTRNRDGRLELFGVDADDDSLVHSWQLQANDSVDWSAWDSLGGGIVPGFAVSQNIVGRVEVFAISKTDHGIKRIVQATPGKSSQWSGWEDFGGEIRVVPSSTADAHRRSLPSQGLAESFQAGLAADHSADGRIEIFGVSRIDDSLLHRWEDYCDDSDRWSPWGSLGKRAQPYPAVIMNEEGTLEVFAEDLRDGAVLNHRRQISDASDWLDWATLDQPTFQYNSRTWQTDEGLPANLVQAITQTLDGFLWVGTGQGLARFDGVSFTTFNAKNTPEIENSSITALCSDRSGALWIGTDGGGLTCLKNGKFLHYGKVAGLAGDTVRAIFETRDGSLWVGTTSGLSRFADGTFRNYYKKDGLVSDVVRSIYEDRHKDLWIATGAGLNRLANGKIASFVMPNGLLNDSVRAICQDQGGRIWIGSNNGMLWYDWYWANHFYAYNTRYGLSDTFVSAICEDREGNLWVGTYSGLNRFLEGTFFVERDSQGLPFGKVNALFADREGDLWVGSNEGLVRLRPMRFTTYTKQQGLTHNNVMSVLEDRAGSLWVGTWGGGLDCLRNERFQAYSTTNFSQNLVLSLCQGHDGSLWIGADYDGGLTRLKDGKSTHYGAKDGLISAGIRVLHEDRRGNLWIGTSRGLSCLADGKFTNYLSGKVVRAICEDSRGQLWFGTETGLCWLGNGKFVNLTVSNGLSDDTVTALYEDKEGSLWIGTQTGGLNRLRNGQIRSYTTAQGLYSDEIFEILEDDEGWLWMTCSKGVFRVRKDDLDAVDNGTRASVVSIGYGKADGMESPQCNGLAKPGGCKTSDGRLWFPTSKGLVVVDPKTVKRDPLPPSVYIEQVAADKETLPRHRNGAMPISEDAAAAIRVPPGRGELEFRYCAPSFPEAERLRFKYKLEGVDPEWIDAGNLRAANYNNVSPGNYRFRVMACNSDGIWSTKEASLGLELVPHYWQTWWFRVLAGFFIIGSAAGVARFAAVRRMQRHVELLEQRHAIERERGRIARDIHDDLGSSLTRIMMLGERTEEGLTRHEDVGVHIRKIVTSARDTVQSLDEIVWAVNPENDTLDGLVSYIAHYADEFFENTNIGCRLEMPVELPTAILPAEARHDLFLVVKEAFNNCLKHSGATAVRLRVSTGEETMQITIDDNGRGFDLNGAGDHDNGNGRANGNGNGNGRKGNGVDNMRKRIESLGGKFSMTSTPSGGTQITFDVRLTRK
ncbi:MAG TPA: two-component regulator propeller domain-containing protein [Verrucomicrobiae bacterium]|nr:two-component regulator propeller domain-containing protein [Verrucomicrobiae bacterium]